MCYRKVFKKNLGMGEWAPPKFCASSATPPWGFWLGDRVAGGAAQ